MAFSINDLRGMSRPDQLRAAAQFAGVDPKVMDGIWRTESGRGTNMRGPVLRDGTRSEGHFQLKPSTRETWERRLGAKINPDDFTESLLVSAYQVKENMVATRNNVGDALRMYNAGTNRSKWGNPETMAYAAKVMGVPFTGKEQGYADDSMHAWNGGTFANASYEQIMYGREQPSGRTPTAHEATPKPVDFVDPLTPRPVDMSTTVSDVSNQMTVNREHAAVAYAKEQTFGDLIGAGFRESSIAAAGVRAYDRITAGSQDPKHAAWLRDNLATVYKEAQDDDHLRQLLRSGNSEEYNLVNAQQANRTEDRKKLESQGKRAAFMYQLAGSLIDPANLALGALTDGAFTALKVGGTGLIRGGQLLKGVGMVGAEGAVGGLEGSAVLDAMGEHQGLDDYATNAGVGALLGLGAGGIYAGIRGRPQVGAEAMVREHLDAAATNRAELFRQAEAQAGPGASKEEIAAAASGIELKRVQDAVNEITGEVPIEHRLLPLREEDALTGDPAIQEKAIKDGNFDLVANEAERKAFAEIAANADRINAQNPTNEKGLTKASALVPDAESPAMTLLKSESSILRAWAKVILENTTGAGGRRATASITRHFYQRSMQKHMGGWAENYDNFRRASGRGQLAEAFDPVKLKEYNRRVFFEVEARGTKGKSVETDAFVHKGADMWEAGMNYALDLQKRNKTIGYGRLPVDAEGYVTHRLSVETVVKLTADQKRAVADILSQQFQGLNEYATKVKGADGVEKVMVGFDKEFSDTLALQYLERATHRQHGKFELPINIHEPQAADMVSDALDAMNLDKHQKHEIMGTLARGGAGYTKKRLRLDLSAPIPDGNGGSMMLGDLFEQDLNALFHSYSMRVSGEAALARYGVMGSKGAKLVLDAAIARGGVSQKARKAFEQTMNEMLNMRVGEKRHAFMDNLTVATSAARLGQAVVNQFGDFSNAVAALGVDRAIRNVGSMPRLWKEVGMIGKKGEAKNLIIGDLDHMAHIGMEDYDSQRLFDVRDYDVAIDGRTDTGPIGRAIRSAANAQYILSGHRRLVAVQTRGMAEKIMDKALSFIREGKDDVALQDMGFGQSLRDRLKANLDKIATFDKGGRLTKADLYAGDLTPLELQSLHEVVTRGAAQIVQRTFIGETAPWVHDSTLKLLYQFRSYSLTAMEKQWSRNTMNHGHIMAFATLMGSLSWAVPLQMARVHAKTVGMSRKEAEEYKDKNLNVLSLGRATLNYAGASGMVGEIIDAGAGFSAAFGGEPGKAFAKELGQSTRTGGKPFLGGTIAPSLGYVEDGNKAVHGDVEKLLKMLPGSNMIGVQNLLNYVTQKPE